MSLLDSSAADSGAETQSRSLVLLGVLAALVVTGLVFAGYAILRKQHQQKTLAEEQARAPRVESKGPAKAQILVDDALIKGDQTILGGSVKNISPENLNNLVVNLELIRRKDGATEKVAA